MKSLPQLNFRNKVAGDNHGLDRSQHITEIGPVEITISVDFKPIGNHERDMAITQVVTVRAESNGLSATFTPSELGHSEVPCRVTEPGKFAALCSAMAYESFKRFNQKLISVRDEILTQQFSDA